MPGRPCCTLWVTIALATAAPLPGWSQEKQSLQQKADELLDAALTEVKGWKSEADVTKSIGEVRRKLLAVRAMLKDRPELQIIIDEETPAQPEKARDAWLRMMITVQRALRHPGPTEETDPNEAEVVRTGMFRAREHQQRGNYAEAAAAYGRLLPRVVRTYGAGKRPTASVLTDMAECIRKIPTHKYNDQTLESMYRRALDIVKGPGKGDDWAQANILIKLATHLNSDRSRTDDSILKLYKDSLALLTNLQRTRDVEIQIAYAHNNLAEVYRQRAEYAEGERHFTESISLFRNHKHPDIVKPLLYLGFLKFSQGQYDKARTRLTACLDEAVKEGKETPAVADALATLGLLYLHIGQYARAEGHLDCALAIYEKHFPEGNVEMARALGNRAMLYVKLRQREEAGDLWERCLAIQQRIRKPGHGDIALTRHNLGDLHRQLAVEHRSNQQLAQKHLARAKEYLMSSLPAREQNHDKNAPEVGQTLQALGMVHFEAGDHDEAVSQLQRALKIREKRLGETHIDVALNLHSLALVRAAQEEWQEASKNLDRSRQIVRKLMTEELPLQAQDEQFQLLESMREWPKDVAISLGHYQPTNTEAVEQSAACLLLEKALVHEGLALSNQLARRRAGDPSIGELHRRIQEQRQELSRLTHAPRESDANEREKIRTRLAELESNLLHELRTTGAVRLSKTSFEECRAGIPDGAAFVDFVRFAPYDFKAKRTEQPRYAAFVYLPNRELEVVPLEGTAAEINKAVETLRNTIDRTPDKIENTPDESHQALRSQLQGLSERILHPLLKHIDGVTQWVLSPDGDLWLVPWAALPLADRTTLAIEKHVISFVNCGRDLARERMEDKDLGPPLLVANPDFSRGRPAAAAKQDDHKGLRLLGGHPKGPLPELPEVGAIVGELETSLKRYSKQSPRTHQRDQALASKLRDVKRPHILVVGTHGFYLSGKAEAEQEPRRAVANRPCVDGVKAMEASDSPRGNNPLFRCGLYLAGADSFLAGNAAVDAVLTGAELAATDLHGTELVVLLACQTGVGAVRAGDSVASLRQAFQLAGAESVVATLWEVPEKESAQLTEEFFNNLANGQSKPEALRNAQLSIIRGGKEHPWYWAAWTITGPPTPLSPPAQGWTLLAYALPLVLLLVVGATVVYRRRRARRNQPAPSQPG